MTITRIAGAALLLSASLLLAGCGGGSPAPSGPTDAGASSPADTASSPAPSDTAAGSSSAPSTSATTPPFDATCESIVPASTKKDLDAAGAKPSTPGSLYDTDANPLSRFDDYGGILCQLTDDQGGSVVYGYGPITSAQASAEEKILTKISDEHGTNKHGGLYYEVPPVADGSQVYQVYVISPKGYWAYTNGDYLDIQDLVPALPAFY